MATLEPSQPPRAPIAVVQARSSSQRLPDKVLREVGGKPLLAYTLERLQHCCSVRAILVATSSRPEDDRIAAVAKRLEVGVHRGPLEDVLGRFIGTMHANGAEAVVRINGDSPLIDPRVVDRVVEQFLATPCDLATNVFPRTFPKGQSVEVATLAGLERAAAATSDSEDREHVTRYFYRHPETFVIRNVAYDRDLSDILLSVDTADDLALVTRMIAAMSRPHWLYGPDELLALRERARAAAVD